MAVLNIGVRVAPTLHCIRAFPGTLHRVKEVQFPFGNLADAVGQAEAGERFADARWRHLGAEERPILPAAPCTLTEKAWRDIEVAGRQSRAFRVGGRRDEALSQMFTPRMMNLASEDEGRRYGVPMRCGGIDDTA